MKPFNLEEALSGKPVRLREGTKAYVKFALRNQFSCLGKLVGFVTYETGHYKDEDFLLKWDARGFICSWEENPEDIIGMWEEPKPKLFINGIEVPEPVTEETWEEGKIYWYVVTDKLSNVAVGVFNKNSAVDRALVLDGLVFETKEGAGAMARALLNYKVEYKNDDTYKNNYDANNGWIDINEKLPPFETEVLGRCIVDNEELIIIVSREVGDGEYWFSPVNFSGVCTDETVEVSHWQPLPKLPQA